MPIPKISDRQEATIRLLIDAADVAGRVADPHDGVFDGNYLCIRLLEKVERLLTDFLDPSTSVEGGI